MYICSDASCFFLIWMVSVAQAPRVSFENVAFQPLSLLESLVALAFGHGCLFLLVGDALDWGSGVFRDSTVPSV